MDENMIEGMGRSSSSVQKLPKAWLPASQRTAKLRYITDNIAGISRFTKRGRFEYRDAKGRVLRDKRTLARIRSLVIPPAWKHVWICPYADGHLQATGRDDRGRKQYRYHPEFRAIRDATKFYSLREFAEALPRIRRAVKKHLSLKGLPRERVFAAVVALLERTHIRVGNEEYARDNSSFGLTTLQDRHVTVRGSTAQFHFLGKSGKEHRIVLQDRRLAKIVKRCQELPGQDLFQYVDDDGVQQDVTSSDINGYLREVSGRAFTAKDFRTWNGTVIAALALEEIGTAPNQKAAKRNIVEAVCKASADLGNLPSTCRKFYIHPDVVDSYLDGTLFRCLAQGRRMNKPGLDKNESGVLKLLTARGAKRK